MIEPLLKIHNIEKVINAHIIKNVNFFHDLLIGSDAIREFKLIQDDELNILQRNAENVTNFQCNNLISQLDEKDHITSEPLKNEFRKDEFEKVSNLNCRVNN